MNDVIPPHELKIGLKAYRKDVPSVGTVSFEKSQALLAEGRICRGWTKVGGLTQYFQIIRSPKDFPNKTFMMARNEKEILMLSIYLGMEASIPFDLLVQEGALDGMDASVVEKIAAGLMIDCHDCGELNEESSEFCGKCGGPL